MDNWGLISIIVPVYNVEKYLDRCVQSIINQTYPFIEIILVDDGSTDKSGYLCDDYAKKDSRIRVIHKKNGGLSEARNYGLSVADGKYIGFVDSDDWIEPDMYFNMIFQCQVSDAQVAICQYREVYESGLQVKVKREELHSANVLTNKEALEIYVSENNQMFINNSVWSKLFLHDTVKEIYFPVGRKSEDIVYTTEAMCRAKKCVYINIQLYNYVVGRPGSIMQIKDGERMLNDEIPFWREQAECLEGFGYADLADKSKYSFYRRLLFYYVDYMRDKKNRSYAYKLIKELKKDKVEIDTIYHENFIPLGDKVRMKIMLMIPYGYYLLNEMYERCIVPIKRKVLNND